MVSGLDLSSRELPVGREGLEEFLSLSHLRIRVAEVDLIGNLPAIAELQQREIVGKDVVHRQNRSAHEIKNLRSA